MSLTAQEIAALVAECSPLLEGAHVDGVSQPDDRSFLLTLRGARRLKLHLLFAARTGLARFHLVPVRPAALSKPPPFTEVARKLLRGSRIRGIRQVSGDRVVELAFERGAPSGDGDRASALIVHEMIGGKGRLFLLDGGRRVEAVLDPGGGARFGPGDPYRFPETRPSHPAVKGIPVDPWSRLEDPGREGEASFPAPLHLAVALHHERLEAEKTLGERRAFLGGALRKELARVRKAEEKVAADLAGARSRVADSEKGELLKGALGRLRRGMRSIDLENWFDPLLSPVRIELDPALTPLENIEKLFRKARKARRAVPFLETRAAELAARREAMSAALEALELAGSLEAIAEIDGRLVDGGIKLGRPPARAPGGTPRASRVQVERGPARRFVSGEGFEILVGRSARENDTLTLRVARGNDLFLHVSGTPGAHVIVRSVPGKTFPLETILDAAQLALHYSLPERSRAAGARADVDYTPVKYVRKPRGAKPGLVLLSTHKTVRVRLEPERLDRIRKESGDAAPEGRPED